METKGDECMNEFNAREARQITETSDEMINKNLFEPILDQIKEACLKGNNRLILNSTTFSQRRKLDIYLPTLGYTVDYYCGVQWDPCNTYTISW